MSVFKAKLLPTAPLKLVTPPVVLSTVNSRGVATESLSTVVSKVILFPVSLVLAFKVTASL
jgi:hypothetical protein